MSTAYEGSSHLTSYSPGIKFVVHEATQGSPSEWIHLTRVSLALSLSSLMLLWECQDIGIVLLGVGTFFFSAKGHLCIYNIIYWPYKTINLKISLLYMYWILSLSCSCLDRAWPNVFTGLKWPPWDRHAPSQAFPWIWLIIRFKSGPFDPSPLRQRPLSLYGHPRASPTRHSARCSPLQLPSSVSRFKVHRRRKKTLFELFYSRQKLWGGRRSDGFHLEKVKTQPQGSS